VRTLTWFLGVLVLAAWHSILAELGHSSGMVWWDYTIAWIFLGAAAGTGYAVRWAIRMYKAGTLGTKARTPSSAPANFLHDDVPRG